MTVTEGSEGAYGWIACAALAGLRRFAGARFAGVALGANGGVDVAVGWDAAEAVEAELAAGAVGGADALRAAAVDAVWGTGSAVTGAGCIGIARRCTLVGGAGSVGAADFAGAAVGVVGALDAAAVQLDAEVRCVAAAGFRIHADASAGIGDAGCGGFVAHFAAGADRGIAYAVNAAGAGGGQAALVGGAVFVVAGGAVDAFAVFSADFAFAAAVGRARGHDAFVVTADFASVDVALGGVFALVGVDGFVDAGASQRAGLAFGAVGFFGAAGCGALAQALHTALSVAVVGGVALRCGAGAFGVGRRFVADLLGRAKITGSGYAASAGAADRSKHAVFVEGARLVGHFVFAAGSEEKEGNYHDSKGYQASTTVT